MDVSNYFSGTYAEARQKFLAACQDAGATVFSCRNPNTGPDGGELFTDAAWLGPFEASKVLVASSATHGVEGHCGSGCQIGHLRAGHYDDLPPDIAVLLIHAINPHGFAWSRRVTEDNVDFNRNHIEFDQPLPENPGYGLVHGMLVPDDWDGAARDAAEQAIRDFIAEHGEPKYQAYVTGGQYQFADGLFYGGVRPTWSRVTLEKIISERLNGRRAVAVLDYHTGLGPYGHGELICVHEQNSESLRRARAWYGDEVTCPAEGSSSSAIVQGSIVDTYERQLPGSASVTVVAIEYGTLPVQEVVDALRADNWLHLRGELGSPLGETIKKQIRAAFYQDHDDWKGMVFDRSCAVTRKALAGLEAV